MEVEKILDLRPSIRLHKHELVLCQEIKEILKHEELLWFQKSKLKWFTCDDRNTSYFHGCVMAKRKWNKIEELKFESNEWCFDGDALKQQEAIHSMKGFKGRKYGMTLKIDLDKV
ncbi:hypothetical protein J1N35_018666 [Gossypium stocksii]|uniref:Uncharacterized protein n=1 Tax=Gossypium stocksii TaxID=47602 RepID=A0A9D3VPJ4_9ROSI|nr:hypothetical protein J1N35_018666 [Gossypium stocksii]